MDIIHPIQALAAGMEPEGLKEKFGDRVSFCGGVDTQELLVQDVYKRQCTGRAIRLSLTNFKGKIKSAYWMDPVTGMQTFICEVTGKEEAVFLPPEREDGSDSVLVIR